MSWAEEAAYRFSLFLSTVWDKVLFVAHNDIPHAKARTGSVCSHLELVLPMGRRFIALSLLFGRTFCCHFPCHLSTSLYCYSLVALNFLLLTSYVLPKRHLLLSPVLAGTGKVSGGFLPSPGCGNDFFVGCLGGDL